MARFSDAQVAAALLGARAFRPYDFPGQPEIKIAIRCLTEDEADGVEVAALADLEELAKHRKWDLGTLSSAAPELHQRLLERHTVFRAVYDAETIEQPEPVRFFKSAKELAAKLDSGTCTRLYALYTEHQLWVNPLVALDEAGVQELADALGKEPSGAALFGMYERSTLVRLLIALLSARSTT